MKASDLSRLRRGEMRAFLDEQNARTIGLPLPEKPKIKRRSKPRRLEEPIHIAIVRYLESVLPRHWIVHHSRNGGLSKAENGRAKAMGAKAGWLDIVIVGQEEWLDRYEDGVMVPTMWFLEVKDDDGVLSATQKEFIKKLDRLNVKHRVVRSIDDARQALQDWRLPSREVAAR